MEKTYREGVKVFESKFSSAVQKVKDPAVKDALEALAQIVDKLEDYVEQRFLVLP